MKLGLSGSPAVIGKPLATVGGGLYLCPGTVGGGGCSCNK
jgi:hypothetical protein